MHSIVRVINGLSKHWGNMGKGGEGGGWVEGTTGYSMDDYLLNYSTSLTAEMDKTGRLTGIRIGDG